MKDLKDTCRVAVVQCAPVMFDKKAGTEKMVELIREAGKNGAELIVFPELIIPCYPYGMTFGYTVGSRDKVGRLDWKRYYDNSLCVPGPETELLGQAAKEVHAYVSIGVSERGEDSATLYNSNLVFSPEGELLNVHRKLKPTGAERLVYGDANKDYFPITDTPWGPMGNLICWESYMPLARVALYQKGITLYISPNTNDNPEWQDTIKHIAIEEFPGALVHNVRTFNKLCEVVGEDSDVLGLNLDPSHLMIQGAEPIAAARALGDKIFYVHGKDARPERYNVDVDGLLENLPVECSKDRTWNYVAVGCGRDLQWWKEFFSVCHMMGYDGYVSLEMEDLTMSVEAGLETSIDALKATISK